ncbi:zf-HC2 domain-containing protein [Amycolatopsis mediterranei]|uniref:zf-HC2 domain-containing protein n=1 Tax=Amycolatopsis mediterranei TaxID=33910 RepID=UPI0004A182ED|nr:zf-HC2 domain-containing protein [Amycolatopsis mediterranei]KDO07392.1 membrane protein [Amycolatopsis mediterranei]KDU91841.1 membrane protein [Amycolatopsis mediterranei]UZF69953.1 zf-HC2 domain-containing protein [Amycolatopsis mediterranei]
MRCEECREALSARLDGEAEPASPDEHLASCAKCREWFAGAERLRRAMLLRPAPPVPDLTAAILERTPAPSGDGWGLRIALAVVAIAQLGPAFAQLLGTAHDGGHLGHESGAWNLAVGIGPLTAALRPKTAGGQLPLLTGFVGVLAVWSAGDLAAGQVALSRVATHVLVVLGPALLYAVHRGHRDRGTPLPAATADDTAATPGSTVDAPTAGRPRPRAFRRQAHSRHVA